MLGTVKRDGEFEAASASRTNGSPVVGVLGYLVLAKAARAYGLAEVDLALFALNYFERALTFDMLPIAIPTLDPCQAEAYLDLVNGLIFTGGSDVHPDLYGHSPHPRLGQTIRERDDFELRLARGAIARRIPILGICRGMQLLNVALGGTLEQHLALEEGWLHHGGSGPVPVFHEIEVVDSELQELVGERATVNSLHHQAVRDLSQGLRVAARSRDGVVEAALGVEAPILVVQWHPERIGVGHPAGDGPFRWLRRQVAALARGCNSPVGIPAMSTTDHARAPAPHMTYRRRPTTYVPERPDRDRIPGKVQHVED